MADKTKTQSRKHWRGLGYHVMNAEFFVQIGGGRKIKQDLFGFVDLVAIPRAGMDVPEPLPWPQEITDELAVNVWPTIYIQVTSWAHVPTRRRKILEETTGKGQWEIPMVELADGLRAGGALVLVEGWKKVGRLWAPPRRHWFTEEELE